MRWLHAWFFKLIRPMFVKDIDPNEDFACIWCSRPVLERVLFCSAKCLNDADFWLGNRTEDETK